MEISKRLRRIGFRVECFFQSVKTVSGPSSWEETLARHTRWITVIKAQRPRLLLSYPLLFFNSLLVYSLLITGLLYSANAASGLLLFLSTLLLRLLVGFSAGRMLGLHPRPGQLVVHAAVADVLLLWAFIRALKRRNVQWRGKTLSFTKSGELKDFPIVDVIENGDHASVSMRQS